LRLAESGRVQEMGGAEALPTLLCDRQPHRGHRSQDQPGSCNPGRGGWVLAQGRRGRGRHRLAERVPLADRIQAVSRDEDRQDFFEVLTSTGIMTGSTSVLPQRGQLTWGCLSCSAKVSLSSKVFMHFLQRNS